VCTTADGLLTAVAQPLWPAFVEAAVADDRAWEWRSLRNGSLTVTGLAVAGGAVIIAFGAAGLRLWLHQDLHFSAAFFWVMAAWIVLMSLPRVAGLLLNAVGILRIQMLILAGGTAAALIFKVAAAQHFGATGILAGAPAAWLLIVVPGFAWRAWRWIVRPAMAAS
jgi:O-antigen/teichoic acid export membrane protein